MGSNDTYVCTLTQASVEKAKVELNENPEDRMAAVEALRKWILQQPHLKCRTDTPYLLVFLRGAKFSQLRAREMIDGILATANLMPEYFASADTHDARLRNVLNTGFMVPLPRRLDNGCQVLLFRIGCIDPESKNYGMKERMRAGMAVGHYFNRDENIQVNGLIYVIDMTGVTMKHFTSGFSLEDRKKFGKSFQKYAPGRFKAFHYYNAGILFDTIMTIGRMIMNKKFQERIHKHETLESLYKVVPMEYLPEEYLPDDYTGPNAGPTQRIVDNFIGELLQEDFRQDLLYTTNRSLFYLDESKRQKEDAPSASFRKLNVD